MKLVIMFIGLATILVGLLPILEGKGWFTVSFIPTTGTAYNVVVIVLGILGTWYGFKHKENFVK
ncbi:MAG TPA: hypothetical protein VJB94_03085 [Candidatus Nanoarchaeia archaeon]|nr:hypothetical protein [Candidatus Nanoarchaeia archaeon]